MADKDSNLATSQSAEEHAISENKGKGKAAAEQISKNEPSEDDDDEDDESEEDEEEDAKEGDEEAEDGMEEIDLNNIVDGGRRTRGAKIDFAKAAEQHPAEEEEDEEDDDFEPPAEDSEMKG